MNVDLTLHFPVKINLLSASVAVHTRSAFPASYKKMFHSHMESR